MRVGIGPLNTAGQGYRLAVALREHGIDAVSFGTAWQFRPPLTFPVDVVIESRAHWASDEWKRYIEGFTHLIIWGAYGPTGGWFWNQPKSAVVFQGSELRVPSQHLRLEKWSPFDLTLAFDRRLERTAQRIQQGLQQSKLPRFVATAGMIDYCPDATWLPTICKPIPHGPVLTRDRPVLLHSVTNNRLKGSHHIPDLPEIETYRPPLMSPPTMLRAIADADIIIGNLLIGDYGGTEAQGLAAGRVVVCNLSPRTLSRLPERPPIVHATPDTLPDVLRDIARNPQPYRDLAAQGPAYHARYHDGSYSVAQLGGVLR